MGNYVIAAGNYVIVSPLDLGNYKIADTDTCPIGPATTANSGQSRTDQHSL